MSPLEAPTIRQLLQGDSLRGGRVEGGASGLDRPVEEVVVAPLEGPLSVPPGALVIVVPRAGTDVQVELLLRQVHTARGTGVILLGGPHLMLSTRRFADRAGVPLVLLLGTREPLALAWEITRSVRDPGAPARPLNDRLLRRLGAPLASAAELVEVLGAELRADVAILTAEGAPLAGGDLELPASRATRTVGGDGAHLLCVPVHVEEAAQPDLWLLARIGPSHPVLVEASLQALQLAALALAVWAARQRLDGERDARDRGLLLSELMDGAVSLPRYAVERAIRAGWRLEGWHVGVYVRTSQDTSVVRLASRVRQALESERLSGPLVERSDGWAAWTTTTREPPSLSYRAVADRVRRALEALGDEVEAVAGVGRPYLGPAGIGTSLREAREASLFAGRGSRRSRVEHIDELGVRRVLSDWHRSEAFRAYARSLLQPLLASGDGQLLDTLRTYLELESSTASTAAALHLHRNTVALRVARIEDLLGLPLNGPDERLVLQLACRVVQEMDGS